MSIVVRFTLAGLTAEQYGKAVRMLEDQGAFPPEGLDSHVCFGSDGDLRVSETWDSEEQFEAFGKRLTPVLAEVGIKAADPRRTSTSTTSSSASPPRLRRGQGLPSIRPDRGEAWAVADVYGELPDEAPLSFSIEGVSAVTARPSSTPWPSPRARPGSGRDRCECCPATYAGSPRPVDRPETSVGVSKSLERTRMPRDA